MWVVVVLVLFLMGTVPVVYLSGIQGLTSRPLIIRPYDLLESQRFGVGDCDLTLIITINDTS
jgi:hypothetical protein